MDVQWRNRIRSMQRICSAVCVGILATESSLQILRILRILQILQLNPQFQLVGSRVIGTWLYRGVMSALLKYGNQFNAIYSTAQTTFSTVCPNFADLLDLSGAFYRHRSSYSCSCPALRMRLHVLRC